MKHFYLILITIFTISNSYSQSNFEKGYNNGFPEGFCYPNKNCLKPITPITPVPRTNENYNSYKDGYNRGFDDGQIQQKSNVSNKSNNGYKTAQSSYVEDNIYNPLANVNLNDIYALSKALKESKAIAIEHLNNGNYKTSAQISASGLKINPQDEEFMIILAKCYESTGYKKNALRLYRKALWKSPNNKNLKNHIKKLKNEIRNN